MKITVKLFATYRTGRFKIEDREYREGSMVRTVVDELGLQDKNLGTALINSRTVDLDRELAEGDVLALFPVVGGG